MATSLSPPFLLQNLSASANAEKHDHLDQVARSEPNRLCHGSLKSHCRKRQEECLKQMKTIEIKLACTSCHSLACKSMELGKATSNVFQGHARHMFKYYRKVTACLANVGITEAASEHGKHAMRCVSACGHQFNATGNEIQ